jgi:hypothetical protein
VLVKKVTSDRWVTRDGFWHEKDSKDGLTVCNSLKTSSYYGMVFIPSGWRGEQKEY